jgi:hypothetical protein
MSKPDWDLLVIGAAEDPKDFAWFPADITRDNKNLMVFEGLRFRNAYLTSRAIETGSVGLFQHLYVNARITGGKVLHISDYRETE